MSVIVLKVIHEGRSHPAYPYFFLSRNAVLNGIHPKTKFRKVRLVRLVGMMLIVLVQEKHLAYVRNCAIDTVGTGIMNKMVISISSMLILCSIRLSGVLMHYLTDTVPPSQSVFGILLCLHVSVFYLFVNS